MKIYLATNLIWRTKDIFGAFCPYKLNLFFQMPKLTYFALHGRATHIRLLLKHAGKEYEEVTPGQNGAAAWPEMKAANSSLGGLPWYEKDSKKYNQSHAILRALASENGYQSSDPWVQYESDWVFETFQDCLKPEYLIPMVRGQDATDDQCNASKELFCKLIDILEDRFKDGRKYCAGDQITASDFKLLAEIVACVENPKGRNQAFNDALNSEYVKRVNVKRICETVKGENGLAAYIEELNTKNYTF